MEKEIGLEIYDVINQSNNILLHCHPAPDGDSVGSSLAMYHALKSVGKRVDLIWGDSGVVSSFSFLPGFDDIINKNYTEIDKNKYDLFIILDSSSKEMISKKIEIEFPTSMKTAIIDHHSSNKSWADINLVIPTVPATAQIVYELLKLWNIEITKDIADCIIIGMYTDTGGFKYRSVNKRTFEIMADLVSIQERFDQTISNLENNLEKERVDFIGLALSNIDIIFDGQVALSVVTDESLKNKNISNLYTQKNNVANILKSIKGVMIGIECVELSENEVKLSLRSKDENKYDVSILAESLGGGGHKSASGVYMRTSLSDAKQKLLEAIKNFL